MESTLSLEARWTREYGRVYASGGREESESRSDSSPRRNGSPRDSWGVISFEESSCEEGSGELVREVQGFEDRLYYGRECPVITYLLPSFHLEIPYVSKV
jgi:hypothetical protein